MPEPITRRAALKTAVAGAVAALPVAVPTPAEARLTKAGWVVGHMSGARALVQTLIAEGTLCVFGIPGAQENELWDEIKQQHVPYLLSTHEFSAACMADGCARSTGRPGVLCVVPGPGLTNSLTGIGEALLDSIPMVCIVGDVARGEKYKPFQVHELPQVGLLQQVTKEVFAVQHVGEIPCAVRKAFQLACAGEPGPVGVVVPYNLLMEAHKFESGPLPALGLPFDDGAFHCAVRLLSDRRLKVGIYAGLGCMAYGPSLVRAAEMLQAPVATSVSGKGVIDECHPLAVGWGYGPQGTCTAEKAFKKVDCVLAIGVRYSEVSTAFYNIPKHRHVIHVDANPNNLGRVVKSQVCVNADAGVFLTHLLGAEDQLARPCDGKLTEHIKDWKCDDARTHAKGHSRCGVDPMHFLLALRRATCPDALIFVDVSATEHWMAEAFCVRHARTYFNPTDNQSMGWSVPAAIGAQYVQRGRQVVAVTGDGCFLMSMVETSTAAREGLPVKFFVLDDHTYHYMQLLQKAAYKRTTATVLAGLDYEALAKGFGLAYLSIDSPQGLEGGIAAALAHPGPMLVRVCAEYGKRPIRWINAAKQRFTDELSTEQKVRFLARLSARSLHPHLDND